MFMWLFKTLSYRYLRLDPLRLRRSRAVQGRTCDGLIYLIGRIALLTTPRKPRPL